MACEARPTRKIKGKAITFDLQKGGKMQESDLITSIQGIGKVTAGLLNKLGVFTVGDLLHYYPHNYETFAAPVAIAGIRDGETVTIEASLVKSAEVSRIRNKSIVSCVAKDPSGSVRLTWFNQPYMKNTLSLGVRYLFRGKVTKRRGSLVMEQAKLYKREEYLRLLSFLQPVYGLTEGLRNNTITKAMRIALAECEPGPEKMPRMFATEYGLISHRLALAEIHFPKTPETMQEARKRLVFEEFFRFMVVLEHYKENKEQTENNCPLTDTKECERLIASLPYELTGDQKTVWEEIKRDIAGGRTMARLVQGDVGSGKTILAFLSMLAAVKSGYQAAMMAPTDVLARQHYTAAVQLLEPLGCKIELLVGSMTATQKKKALERIADHRADIVIGTQALFQQKVTYSRLGLVITDEQHRFGVKQREMFSDKGEHPHILVMSATPIPRTLAIILYGDLDISVIHELPKGRQPIKNCVVNTGYRETAYRFIKKQISEGRQAYIICAMVEESETTEAENVISYTEQVREALGDEIRVEYLHGKMAPAEKNERMEQFAAGEIQVLVSTTVIEVGVNVPNATVMMIENAERFGLAQLHQLRGRVGRGKDQSYCIMVSSKEDEKTMERLEILNRSNDGFFIASEDLRLRGPGDLFGIRQSGELAFQIGDVYTDAEVLRQASKAVKSLKKEQAEEYYQTWYREETEEMVRNMAESI